MRILIFILLSHVCYVCISQIDEHNIVYSSAVVQQSLQKELQHWQSIFESGQYEKAENYIWDIRTKYSKPDYFIFLQELFGSYESFNATDQAWNLKDNIINYYGPESEEGKRHIRAKIGELTNFHHLIDAKELLDKHGGEDNHTQASILYGQLGEKDKAIYHAQKAIDQFEGKKSFDYYIAISALAQIYKSINIDSAEKYFMEAYEYYNSKDEKMFDMYYHNPLHAVVDLNISKGLCEGMDTILNKVKNAIQNDEYQKDDSEARNKLHFSRYYSCLGDYKNALKALENFEDLRISINLKLDLHIQRLRIQNIKGENIEKSSRLILEIMRKIYLKITPFLSDRELINFNYSFEKIKDELGVIITTSKKDKLIKKFLELEFLCKSSYFQNRRNAKESAKKIARFKFNDVLQIDSLFNKVGLSETEQLQYNNLKNIDFNLISNSLTENELFINISFFSYDDSTNYNIIAFDKGKIVTNTTVNSYENTVEVFKNILTKEGRTYERIILSPDKEWYAVNPYSLYKSYDGLPDFKVIYGFQTNISEKKFDTSFLLGKSLFTMGDSSFINNDRQLTFQNLPAVKKEINSIYELLTENQITTEKILDENASIDYLKTKDLSPYNIIHFATHGYFDTTSITHQLEYFNPQVYYKCLNTSGLLLSDNQSEVALFNSEKIKKAEFPNTNLVVLSACHSGLGYETNDFGILGLTRSFIQKGVDNILFTTKSVNDNISFEFMSNFYKNLISSDNNVNQAFNLTQKSLAGKHRGDKINRFLILEPFIIESKIQDSNISANYYQLAFVVMLFMIGYLLMGRFLKRRKESSK